MRYQREVSRIISEGSVNITWPFSVRAQVGLRVAMDCNRFRGDPHIVIQQPSKRLSDRFPAPHELPAQLNDMDRFMQTVSFRIDNNPICFFHIIGEDNAARPSCGKNGFEKPVSPGEASLIQNTLSIRLIELQS